MNQPAANWSESKHKIALTIYILDLQFSVGSESTSDDLSEPKSKATRVSRFSANRDNFVQRCCLDLRRILAQILPQRPWPYNESLLRPLKRQRKSTARKTMYNTKPYKEQAPNQNMRCRILQKRKQESEKIHRNLESNQWHLRNTRQKFK